MSAAPPTEDEVVMEGYLTKSPPIKRPDSKTISSWKQRYFKLKRYSKRLEYYRDKSATVPKGFIDLNRCWHISDAVTNRRHEFLFCVAVPERKFFMIAGSKVQRDTWMQHLREVCKQPYRRLATRGATTPPAQRASSVPVGVARRDSGSSTGGSDHDQPSKNQPSATAFRHDTAPGGTQRTTWGAQLRGKRSTTTESGSLPTMGIAAVLPLSQGSDVAHGAAAGAQSSESRLQKLMFDTEYIPGFSQTDEAGEEDIDYDDPITVTATLHNDLIRIIVNFPNLELCAFADDEILQSWPLLHLRRYAQQGNVFEFEAGRHCPTGEGVHSLKLEDSSNLELIIDRVLERHHAQDTSPMPIPKRTPQAVTRSGYEQLLWHDGRVTIGDPDDMASPEPARSTPSFNTPPRLNLEPSVEYTAIDQVKTAALQRARALHRHGDVLGAGSKLSGGDEDDTVFGFDTSESMTDRLTPVSRHSFSLLADDGLDDSSRATTPASAKALRRRYVNVSNSQLSVVIKQEQGAAGTVASTIYDDDEEANQSVDLVDEIDQLCRELDLEPESA